MPSSRRRANSSIVFWLKSGGRNRSAGQSHVKMRADPTLLGSIHESESQFTHFASFLLSSGSFHVHVSGDFVSRPWTAMMSMSVCRGLVGVDLKETDSPRVDCVGSESCSRDDGLRLRRGKRRAQSTRSVVRPVGDAPLPE